MNNVFDFKRFGKYFAYDLNNAWSNFGVSALVIGLLPLIMLIFNVLFGLVFNGEANPMALAMKVTLFFVVFVVLILAAPTKLYGRLTERRVGSDWLMIPASSFEKFLSMALMLCVVLPVAVFGLFAVCDLLLGWLFPVYGGSMVKEIATNLPSMSDMAMTFNGVPATGFTKGGIAAIFFLTWCASILPFGLGAICFKKGKAAKTILCIFALEMVLSILLVLIFKVGFSSGFDFEQLMSRLGETATSEKAQFWSNFFLNLNYLIVVGGLLVALFFRVKTIKH